MRVTATEQTDAELFGDLQTVFYASWGSNLYPLDDRTTGNDESADAPGQRLLFIAIKLIEK